MPYGEKLWVSDNGRYFLVCAGLFPTKFKLYEHREGSRPPYVVRKHQWSDEEVVIDRKDRLVRSGSIDQRPVDAWVLSGAPRAVLFDQYGSMGYGTTLSLLEPDGKLRWKLKLNEFKFDRQKFGQSVSSIWWSRGWWVDEARGKIVIVARGGQFREVDIDSGKITTVGPSVVMASIVSESSLVRRAILGHCSYADFRPQGWDDAARKIRDDKSRSMAERLTAARALYFGAKEKPPIALYREAVGAVADHEVRRYVLDDASRIFESDGVPLLVALREAYPRGRSHSVAVSLIACGRPGIAAVGKYASDPQTPRALRLIALGALAQSYAVGPLETFARIVRAEDESFAREAIPVGGNIRLAEVLATALERPGAGDESIARLLRHRASRKFVRALEIARARHASNPAPRAAIDAALKACRAARR